MKNLLAIIILFVSTPSFANLGLGSSLFGGLGQCGATDVNSMMLPLLMMQAMSAPVDPVKEIDNQIDDLKALSKDLKEDIRSIKRAAASAERRTQLIDQRIAELGCKGVIGKDPISCFGLSRQRSQLQNKAMAALDEVEALRDEIRDNKDELRDLRAERSEASKQKAEMELQQAMQKQMMADMLSKQRTQLPQQPNITGPAGFSNGPQPTMMRPQASMQATCPFCNVQAFSGAAPNTGVSNLSSQLAPILAGQIQERNRQLGWPNTPTFRQPQIAQPNLAAPFIGGGSQRYGMPPMHGMRPTPMGMVQSSAFGTNCYPTPSGPQFGGAYGGVPMASHGGQFPGGSISPAPTPFSQLPPVPVNGRGGILPNNGGLRAVPVARGGSQPGQLAPIQVRSAR